jgi:cytoskeletal protein CcmA (bactofilin family)
MSKFSAVFLVFCFAFLFLSVPPVPAKVISLERGIATVSRGEVINDDLFIAAETVEIYGTVNGDVYAGAGTVRIDGIINGSVHAGGGMVYLGGKVSQSAYIGAGNVSLNSAVIGDSLLVGAGTVNIDTKSSIGGSLLAGTGTISVYSPVKRNVFIGGGNVDIDSAVGGEVRVGAGNISLGPDTRIAKDLYYAMGDNTAQLNISGSATVGGTINQVENKFAAKKDLELAKSALPKALATFRLVANIISLAGALIIGFLCLKLFNKPFSGSASRVINSFFASLGVGFLICVVALPALVILALTGVGAPLAGLLFLILLINIYLAKIVAGLAVGNWLAAKFSWKNASVYAVFAAGLVAVYLFKMIPFFGFFVSLVVLWTGLGALALHYKSSLKS